jgi:hypothetical protein
MAPARPELAFASSLKASSKNTYLVHPLCRYTPNHADSHPNMIVYFATEAIQNLTAELQLVFLTDLHQTLLLILMGICCKGEVLAMRKLCPDCFFAATASISDVH